MPAVECGEDGAESESAAGEDDVLDGGIERAGGAFGAADEEVHRRGGEVACEVIGGADDELHLLREFVDFGGVVDVLLAVFGPGLPVEFADALALRFVADGEELPDLHVAAGGGADCGVDHLE